MKTILIVDDDPGIRRFVARVLRGVGLTVLTASSAREAVSIIESASHQIHLVVTDMVMPGTSGLDLGCELQQRYPCMKVLYMSGYRDSIAMVAISKRSPEHALLKPFSRDALLASVLRLLAKQACGGHHI
ncbi:MAG TPA: response regulator [Bryobacteraceae bacterium]|nr:response regulator [Bryobacteraceae bacterium]